MKTAIITGATSGLGLETARKVAATPGWRVVLACRNVEKGEAVRAEIVSQTGNPAIEVRELDTSSLASVRAFADGVRTSDIPPIDTLLCNAGISGSNPATTSPDGFDIVFATNYLGHFLLVNLLLDCMAVDGRIISVSSDMHNPPDGIEWPPVEQTAAPHDPGPQRYQLSKLAQIYFTHELARRLEADGSSVTANAFNPGLMTETNFVPGRSPEAAAESRRLHPDRVGNVVTSSDALAALVTQPQFAGMTGLYFDRGTVAVESSALSYDEANAHDLWEASLRYTGLA